MDRLLVGVSGSVAVLNVPSYLAALRAGLAGEITGDHDLPGGRIRAAWEVTICDGVFVDQEPTAEKRPGHIELARWGEMFVILPASAKVIGQAANGLATTILASPRPVVF